MRIEKVFFTYGYGVVNIFSVKRVFAKTLKKRRKLLFEKVVFDEILLFYYQNDPGPQKSENWLNFIACHRLETSVARN